MQQGCRETESRHGAGMQGDGSPGLEPWAQGMKSLPTQVPLPTQVLIAYTVPTAHTGCSVPTQVPTAHTKACCPQELCTHLAGL